jgi:hypothetical protein
MAEQPKIVELGENGFYTLSAVAQEFVDIMPKSASKPSRLRFRLGTESGPAISLDVPISENCLNRLRLLLSQT